MRVSAQRGLAGGVALGLALWLGAPGRAQDGSRADPSELPPEPQVLAEAWSIFRDQFYDRDLHGVDWEDVRARYVPRAERAESQAEVYDAVVDMLGELGASHSQLIEPDVFRQHYESEAKNLLAPIYGMQLVRLDEGYFVGDVVHGSVAEAAGVQRGDCLLKVDGTPARGAHLWPVPYDAGLGGPRAYRVPTTAVGQPVTLELRRSERPKGVYTVTLTSAEWNELEACRVSQRIVTRSGLRIGYMRLYHLLSDDVPLQLAEFLAGPLADADAVVVDLRGRGGLPRCVDAVLRLFDPNTPGGPLWSRPAVALIDRNTRSAKEILAFEWRQRRIGPLVGTNSAGAVLGARFQRLGDGSYLLFPFMDMRAMTGGQVLEGDGVAPDVAVVDRLPYQAGADPVVEGGFEAARDEVFRNQRAGRRHGWY